MIELEPILLQLPSPAASPAGDTAPALPSLPLYLVRVSADEATAYGEAAVDDPAAFAAAVDFFADTIANGDPRDRGLLWQRLVALLREYPPEAAATYNAVLSAVDTALWDLAGRALGVPCRLLAGGSRARQVDCYAGGLEAADPALGDRARQLRRHWAALELSLSGSPEVDAAAVRTLRRAAGEGAPLFVEAGGRYDVYEEALALGRVLEQAEVFWWEAPLPEGRWEDYHRLREAVAPALAAGRRLTGLGDYAAALAQESLDVAVADPRLYGGLSAGQRLADLCWLHGTRVSFHCGFSPWAQLGAAQLIAAHWHAGPMQVRPLSGAANEPLRAALAELLQPAPAFADGFLKLPDGPGLGALVNEDALERYRVEMPSDE